MPDGHFGNDSVAVVLLPVVLCAAVGDEACLLSCWSARRKGSAECEGRARGSGQDFKKVSNPGGVSSLQKTVSCFFAFVFAFLPPRYKSVPLSCVSLHLLRSHRGLQR